MDEINWETLGQVCRQQDILDDRMFVEWSNYLLEWQVKKVPLPKDFEVVLRYKLARYGMGKMFGDDTGNGTRFDWTPAVDRVQELVDGIRMEAIEDMEEHLNGEFLLRLQLILNELQDLVGVVELREIPLREMEFCLAVFLLASNGESEYGIFKLMLLPTDVMGFLQAVVSSMHRRKYVDDEQKDKICDGELQQFCKLKMCHKNVENLYNMVQIAENDVRLSHNSDCIATMISSKLKNVSFGISNANRLCEKIFRVLCLEKHQGKIDNELLVKLSMLKTLAELEVFVCISMQYQHFLSVIKDCHSLEQIKLLCRYISSAEEICKYHETIYLRVSDFYSKLYDQLGNSAVSQNVADKVMIIKSLKKSCVSFARINFSKMVNLVENNVDVTKVQQLLQQEMGNRVDEQSVQSIHTLWSTLAEEKKFIKSSSSWNEERFLMPSHVENCTLLRELSEAIKAILINFKCFSLSDLSVNYETIPRYAELNLRYLLIRYFEELSKLKLLEDDISFVKSGHKVLCGQTFFRILTSSHPKYEVFASNSTRDIAIVSLIIAEGHSDALLNKILLAGINNLKNIRLDGLKWVQMQGNLRNALLNTNESHLEELINQGAYPINELFEFCGRNCNVLKNVLAKLLYNKLYPTNSDTVSILKVVMNQITTQDFKLNVALARKSYDEAFKHSEKHINTLNPSFFSWDRLIFELYQTESESHIWQNETFAKVAQKLIDVANVQSLTYLLSTLDELFVANIEYKYSDYFRMLRTLRTWIRESVIQTEFVDRLNHMILAFIFKTTKSILGNIVSPSFEDNYSKLYDLLSPLPNIPADIDIWLVPTLPYRVIDCDKLSDHQKLLLLKFCHALGHDLWVQPPHPCLPVMTYAHSKVCDVILNFLLDWCCQDFRETHVRFAVVIQQNSVDIFELFLSKNKYTDEDVFRYVSNALQELYVEQTFITMELKMFLWYKLAKFGFDNLCSNSAVLKNPMEWIQSCHFIIEDVRQLKHRSDRGDFLGVDNEVLFRLRMVHNQLFYIKDKPHFKNLPLKEITTLLGVFLSSFECEVRVDHNFENYIVYRMVLNKLTLMKFLEFIAEQLNQYLKFFTNLVNRLVKMIKESGPARRRENIQSSWKDICKKEKNIPTLSENVWNSLFSKKFSPLLNKDVENVVETVLSTEPVVFIPQKRKQCIRIVRLYHRVKQLYSLRKIFRILQRISSGEDCNEIVVASLKRFNQIFGESIKNTKHSQNLPAKLNRVLNYQLREYILIVKKTRDVTCHDYPLVKKFFPLDEQYTFYARIKEKQIKMLTATVAMLLICTHSEFWRCLYGSLQHCRSLHQIKSLIRFVGDQNNFKPDQVQCLNIVSKYQDDIQESLNAVAVNSLPTDKLNSLERLKNNHARRLGIIEKLREAIEDSFIYTYRDIQIAAFSSRDIQTVNSLLSINLLPKSDYNLLEFIENSWVVLDEDLNALIDVSDLFEHNVIMLQSTLFNLEINRDSMQEYHRRQEVRGIMDSLSDVLHNQSSDTRKLETDLNSRLDRKKYFNNIFLVKHKMQAISDVFESISTSALNDRLNVMRKSDMIELENIFKGIQRSILKIYEKYECSCIGLLIKNILKIPQDATLAIEYWLLELCEILITTNQFQDNFHTLKRDLQMICGRNFRNYLAHDGLSYDILTCSSSLKVLINGLVMAKKDWKLFVNPHPSLVTGINGPRAEGLRWLKEQKQSIVSISDFSIIGRLWMQQSIYEGLRPMRITDTSIVRKNFLIDSSLNNSESKLSTALNNDDFQLIAKNLNGQSLDKKTVDQLGCPRLGALLKYLNEHGNYEELLYLLAQLKMEHIGSYLFTDSEEICPVTANIHYLILCKPLEHLKKLIPNSSVDCSHLKSTVLLNHYEYFKHLINLPRICQQLNDIEFESIIKLCARFGRLNMIQILTAVQKPSQKAIDLALAVATMQQHWELVSFLLTQKNANPWNYINELYAGDLAIRKGNLKLHRKFFAILPRTEFNFQSLLSKAVEFGSVCIVKYLLKMGCDIWQNPKILLNANANRRDGEMLDFIEEVLFKFKADDELNIKLQEWKRIVHERQLLDNFNESSRLFIHSYQRSKRMLKVITNFGKVDDGRSVIKLESCCITCNDPRIKIFRSVNNVASLDINLQCLTPTGPAKSVKVQLENQTLSSDFVFDIMLDIFNAESELSCNFTLSKAYSSKPLTIFVCHDLIKLVDNNTSSSAIIGQFTLETQQIRFIRVGTCLYIAHVGNINSPTYLNGYFNSTNRRGHSIFNSLHSDVDIELIQILLSTGVDLTTVDKSGRNALMLAVDAQCSWDVLKFMLEYCVRNNLLNSQGVHIFDMQDSKGCTLLQYAVLIRRLNVVTFLLDHGVDQEMHDYSGKFPIHYAILGGSLLIADTLIDYKKDIVNLPQINNKYTPLMMAVNMNNCQLVKLLLQKGAEVSNRNDQGETAIAWAISMERYSILCQLLNHSSALETDVLSNVTGENENALQHALLQDNENIFKIVLEHMVGCPLDSNMDQKSLIVMKNILNLKDNESMNIFDNVTLIGHTRIGSYLKQCESFYEQIMGEPLREIDCTWQSDLLEMVTQSTLSSDMALMEIDDLD